MKKKHEHEYYVEEFYTGTIHVVSVAILKCECGDQIWEELVFEKSEEKP